MYKQHLLNNIEKEIKICIRLSTKIDPPQLSFQPKEGLRSIIDLLQYLTIIGVAMPKFWLGNTKSDFGAFFNETIGTSKTVTLENFITEMNRQKEEINQLLSPISEEDLLNRQVIYPWGVSAPLGEAIIATSIKWLAAYKLQLLNLIKMSGDEPLSTADAWALTDL